MAANHPPPLAGAKNCFALYGMYNYHSTFGEGFRALA